MRWYDDFWAESVKIYLRGFYAMIIWYEPLYQISLGHSGLSFASWEVVSIVGLGSRATSVSINKPLSVFWYGRQHRRLGLDASMNIVDISWHCALVSG